VRSPARRRGAVAPSWAGPIALAYQEAGHALGFVNPAIYRVTGGQIYHRAFHESSPAITRWPSTAPRSPATRPDPVGPRRRLGTPDAQILVPLLAHQVAS
jgi:hypothetical protein